MRSSQKEQYVYRMIVRSLGNPARPPDLAGGSTSFELKNHDDLLKIVESAGACLTGADRPCSLRGHDARAGPGSCGGQHRLRKDKSQAVPERMRMDALVLEAGAD